MSSILEAFYVDDVQMLCGVTQRSNISYAYCSLSKRAAVRWEAKYRLLRTRSMSGRTIKAMTAS